MTTGPTPPADVDIDASLVRALLREQHGDLANLPLVDAGEGWDNRLFRLGDHLAVRVPRRRVAAALIEHEQRWLPQIGPRLPLSIPVPLRCGLPGCGYPWAWSITPWLPGGSASSTALHDPVAAAEQLGTFLAALHEPAPSDAPSNTYRGVPLAQRTVAFEANVRLLDAQVDQAEVRAAWDRALQAPPWAGPPLWIHGDLHPGNLLVSEGRLSAVIDFGDLTAGDPATDLAVAWMLFPPAARPFLRASARQSRMPIDDGMWNRARGWALHLGLAYLAQSRSSDSTADEGRAAIDAVLRDDAG